MFDDILPAGPESACQYWKTMKKALFVIFLLLAAAIAAYVLRSQFYGIMTIRQLLAENKELKAAIANLTAEDQIGYAKVIDQNSINGKLLTKVLFVETDRSDKLKRVLEKEYTVEGDIVHFDALIVKFTDKKVTSGQEKALYLWRRVYGEKMAPADAFPIEDANTEPLRYKGLLNKLRLRDRRLFWTSIWSLASDPQQLQDSGITAIYGDAIYYRLQKGFIYVFKITATGQVYPEVVPDI
jgi:hypothetical protein